MYLRKNIRSLYNRKLFSTLSQKIRLYEVTPRDGLQNEKKSLSVSEKVSLIKNLLKTGFTSIELCSFVRGDLVPQMSNSTDLCEALLDILPEAKKKDPSLSFSALVPNMRGYETLAKYPTLFDNVVILTSCSETHSQRNVNMSIDQALKLNEQIAGAAHKDGFKVRAYASLAFGCPFEGKVDPEIVKQVVAAYDAYRCEFVVLADTWGHATPLTISDTLNSVYGARKPVNVGMHLHDANGKACENALEAIKFGIVEFDSAIGGCGGCNFVTDAKGNIAVEDLLTALYKHQLEIEHPLNLDILKKTNSDLSQSLGRELQRLML